MTYGLYDKTPDNMICHATGTLNSSITLAVDLHKMKQKMMKTGEKLPHACETFIIPYDLNSKSPFHMMAQMSNTTEQ